MFGKKSNDNGEKNYTVILFVSTILVLQVLL